MFRQIITKKQELLRVIGAYFMQKYDINKLVVHNSLLHIVTKTV